MEKSDRYMFAKDLDEQMTKMRLKGKFLSSEQKMKVVLTCYSNLRKKISKK